MNPAISIIVPVYNVEPYLEKCIDSILAQTFTDFELLLVDDGSTDRSGTICDRYANQDARVKVFHKEYGGVSSARNVGIENAKGEFIGFVDSDDRIDRKMYQTLYHLCREIKSDIAVCKLGREVDGVLINKDEKDFKREMDNEEGLRELFKGHLYRFSLCNKLFSKKCFDGVYFPEGRIHEDLSTTYKLFSNAAKTVYINDIGYIYIKRENSILTKKYYDKRLDAFIGWDEIIPFMSHNYPNLKNEVLSAYVYWAVDNVYYILNQVERKSDRVIYINIIKRYLSKYYEEIKNNKNISFKYKSVIKLLVTNYKLFLFANRAISYVKS